ncbi:MAG: glycosyltransferase family A protein [Bacteroidetes bacterium]|nr:glycosyltransferase family A protein [Bacteroidota bacterium]
MKPSISLGYAIATVDSKILENRTLIEQLKKTHDSVVIVNQFDSRPLDQSALGEKVLIINSKTRGLSRSRNIALDRLKTDFAIICDDDITLIEDGIIELKKSLQEQPSVALFYTRLLQTTGLPWRNNYESTSFDMIGSSFRNNRRIQRINSMEQVYNLNFLREYNLLFNINHGVGSGKIPLGEETLMAASILKSGGRIQYLPVFTRSHPPHSSGSSFNWSNAYSILRIHHKIFGWLCPLTFTGYLSKSLIRLISKN